MQRDLTREQVATLIDDFVEGRGGPWTWDDFTLGMRFRDPFLESIRVRCACLCKEFPSTDPGQYCNEADLQELKKIAQVLNAER